MIIQDDMTLTVVGHDIVEPRQAVSKRLKLEASQVL